MAMYPRFVEILSQNLSAAGFDEQKINELINTVDKSHDLFAKETKQQQQSSQAQQNEAINTAIIEFMKNPQAVVNSFKPGSLQRWLNFFITPILVGAVTFLGYTHIIGPTETSTLLGGIVGYLLGNKS